MGGLPLRRIEERVRERVRQRGLDPAREPDAVRAIIDAEIDAWDEAALAGDGEPIENRPAAIKHVTDAVAGFGPLQPLLDDPGIEEIWINSPREVYVARAGVNELTNVLLDEGQVRALVERMLALAGRRLDLSNPFVDASLPGGERLHVAIPDVTRRHWAVNIRKFVARAQSVEDLVGLGALTPQAAAFLAASVRAGLTVLVSGGTQAGKTTTLGALTASIPPRERVVTCEEVFEMRVNLRDWIPLQCRQPSLEGTGEISLRRLVKEALRMRPNRLIVGEVREAEALDLLIALNSGVPPRLMRRYTHGNALRNLLPHEPGPRGVRRQGGSARAGVTRTRREPGVDRGRCVHRQRRERIHRGAATGV